MNFTKMHGLGNDFIVINTITTSFSLDHLPIKQLSHRQLGIGFDQLLVIGTSKTADFSCQIYNADGSIAEQCGNGMRCVARYVHEEKLTPNKTISIETKAGIIHTRIHDYDHIQVNMGLPLFPKQSAHEILLDKPYQLTTLSMGNPHAILKIDSIDHCPVNSLGQQISTHALFPEGTNVGFMEIIDRSHIRLRTYERGSGETLACGSNACAAVASGINQGQLDSLVTVQLPLGNLTIEWQNSQSPLLMTGPAKRVFYGNF